MANFDQLSQALQDKLAEVVACTSGEVEDGYTDVKATVRQCPRISRRKYSLDISLSSTPVDEILQVIDFATEIADPASQGEADLGAAFLIEQGAADYDDAAKRALRLLGLMTWRVS